MEFAIEYYLISWTGLFLSSLLILLSFVYVYLTWHYGVLEKMGIPVKKPYFCFGSVPFQYYRLQYYDDIHHMKEYGKIWGIYEGRTPELYVSDPEMIKQMLVKDFDAFHTSRMFGFKDPMMSESLLQIPGAKWKSVRSSLSPLFSSKRMRGMAIILKDNAERLLDHIKSITTSDGLNIMFIKNLYDSFAVDVTAECFFGTKVASVKDPNNEFVLHCRRFFQRFQAPKYQLFITSLFPALYPRLDIFDADTLNFFRSLSYNLIEERRKDGNHYDDYVDILLQMVDDLKNEDKKYLDISLDTVLSQGLLFFIAGFNTTSTTLTMASYLLAMNPKAQEIAYQEVKELVDKYGEINHETIVHLKYIPAVIDETLRLFPLVVRIERECQRDWEYNGMKVPKGVVIKYPAYAMHHSEELFPDPEEFKPERFMKNFKGQVHHPYSYLPFAAGPRNCIGMRFALEEQKLVLSNMILNFRFYPVEETKLDFIPGLVLLVELLAVQDFKLGLEIRT